MDKEPVARKLTILEKLDRLYDNVVYDCLGDAEDSYRDVKDALKKYINLQREYEFLSEHYNELLAEYNEQDKLLKKKNDDYVDKINTINRKLQALKAMSECFVKMGGTKGSFEGEHPKNEVLIMLKDLTEEEFDLIKEELING